MQFKKILAVSAFAGIALGANNSTLTSATPSVGRSCSFRLYTATNSQQIAEVAACATAVGDITINGDGFSDIELGGVEQVYGNLIIRNASDVQTVNAPTLQLVSESFELTSNTILSTLNLAQLTTVGSLTLNALPNLEKAGLTSGITTADSVVISNTGLTSLEGINVYKLKTFNVNNNEDIESIDSGLRSVTDELYISFNADKVDLKFDQLTSAKSISLQSISSFSAPNLTEVSGSLYLISSTVDKFDLENLKSVGNSLVINKNDDLEEIDFPKLTRIGGALQISDNEKFESLEGLDKLQTIGGSLVVNGSFNNGSLESLQRVSGGFNFKTDGDLSCRAFDRLHRNGDIRGRYSCSTNFRSSSSRSGLSSSSSGSSSSSDTGSSSDSSSASSSSSSSSRSSGATSTASVKFGTIILGLITVGVALY